MSNTNKNIYSTKVQKMLDKNNKISIKVANLESKTMRQMEKLLLYTLQFYNMEIWLDYFSLLTSSLSDFTPF